jgi:hypothetical protein
MVEKFKEYWNWSLDTGMTTNHHLPWSMELVDKYSDKWEWRRGEGENEETFIVDTKWKRPTNKSASIEDLRQMYAYGRYWDSDKLMLLYPGKHYDSGYQGYPNKFDLSRVHQCKMGMVSVLDASSLDLAVGEKIINMLNQK